MNMPDVPELPFPIIPSHPGVWRRDERSGAVVAWAKFCFEFSPAAEPMRHVGG